LKPSKITAISICFHHQNILCCCIYCFHTN